MSLQRLAFSVKLPMNRRACAWSLEKAFAVALLVICGTAQVSVDACRNARYVHAYL